MNAVKAQAYIDSLEKYKPPSDEELAAVAHLKVDYNYLVEMPSYVQYKINYALDYIVRKYNPKKVSLVRSYVDGYPIDEKTSIEDFNKLKKIKKTKLSDFDFVVHGALGDRWQVIEQIAPLIKIDLFNHHHGGVKTIQLI